MKNFFSIFLISLTTIPLFSQDQGFKEYSYSYFFQIIEEEKDSIVKIENAIISYNEDEDEEYLVHVTRDSTYEELIVIDKILNLKNVHFQFHSEMKNGETWRAGLINIIFNKSVSFDLTYVAHILNCKFKDEFSLSAYESPRLSDNINYLNNNKDHRIWIDNCEFNNSVDIRITKRTSETQGAFLLFYSTFDLNDRKEDYFISISNFPFVSISKNLFKSEGGHQIKFEKLENSFIEGNTFEKGIADIVLLEIEELFFRKNQVFIPTLLRVNIFSDLSIIDYNQFYNDTGSSYGFDAYLTESGLRTRNSNYLELYDEYEQNFRIQNEECFNFEIEQKSEFYRYFKDKFNTKTANKIYVEIKDLEAERIAYEHSLDPSFSTFFKLRINQFLRLFSSYGTQPERAIVFSVYVILLFALIYLFFPNSWDSHGRNRIIDRYTFFMKYMRRKAGIHEVYLEDKQEELLTYDKFKAFIESSEHEVPRVFTATALPLYKWAISGTRITSGFLKRIDIMKGTWRELPPGKRMWKGFLLTGAFAIAILYDLIIKMLNALMLSINTFTTLGFGEIPIKGLPRYLAIIQGFIGWFMLTIFSVSLISQLLN